MERIDPMFPQPKVHVAFPAPRLIVIDRLPVVGSDVWGWLADRPRDFVFRFAPLELLHDWQFLVALRR